MNELKEQTAQILDALTTLHNDALIVLIGQATQALLLLCILFAVIAIGRRLRKMDR